MTDNQTKIKELVALGDKVEVWRDIKGYEGIYQASPVGVVRSLDRVDCRGNRLKGQLLKNCNNSDGYHSIALCNGGHQKTFAIHKIIARTFIGKSNGLDVNHIDGNKINNNISNLEYVTRRENCTHGKVSHGLVGANWNKKLNKWRSAIVFEGKKHSLGHFETEIEAHQAYTDKLKSFGLENKYADKPNNPTEGE